MSTDQQTALLDCLKVLAEKTVEMSHTLAELPTDAAPWRDALDGMPPGTVEQVQAYLLGAAHSFGALRERFLYLNHNLETITWTHPTSHP